MAKQYKHHIFDVLKEIENKNYRYYESLSEDLSAAQIAERCNLSIPALNKTVARYAGCGVMNYYNSLRLKKAEELLLSGASVKEAALSVGFSNQNYFSAFYKKRKGVSPSHVGT